MRISGGGARGIPLISISGRELRPATGSLREALFSSLGTWIRDKTFLDLFAGTGSYGLEALSRGARGGIFVEKNRRMAGILRQNLQAVLQSLEISSNPCEAYCGDVRRFENRVIDSNPCELCCGDVQHFKSLRSPSKLCELHCIDVRRFKNLGIASNPCEILRGDTRHFRSEQSFDLLFLDPPFVLSRRQAPNLLARVLPLLRSGGRLAFELPADLAPPSHDSLSLLRRLGQTTGHGPSMVVYERK
ncbi:MAG: RsmD family RNA methyltransferase [Puniceicoccales bacterium]|jgi:16S rRNA G966 N2-methylase RsmD|nr:RsmD family RNA methyltransferase [Puniceicoccales bacterium]